MAILIPTLSKGLVKFSQILQQFIDLYESIKINKLHTNLFIIRLLHFKFIYFINLMSFPCHLHLSCLTMFDIGFARHLMVKYFLLGGFAFELRSIRLLIVLTVDRLLIFIDCSFVIFNVNSYSLY